MLKRIALALALAAMGSNAIATTTVTQDRDNDIRNAYQKASKATCDAKTSCALVFPAVPKNQRLLVGYISCLIVNSAPVGVTVSLYPASTPTSVISFYPVGSGDSATSNEYFGINAQTRLYVEAGDRPKIAVNGTSPFIGTASCFVSGETVNLP